MTHVAVALLPSVRNDIMRHIHPRSVGVKYPVRCCMGRFSSYEAVQSKILGITQDAATEAMGSVLREPPHLQVSIAQKRLKRLEWTDLDLATSDRTTARVYLDWPLLHKEAFDCPSLSYMCPEYHPRLAGAIAREVARWDDLRFNQYSAQVHNAMLPQIRASWSEFEEHGRQEKHLRRHQAIRTRRDVIDFLIALRSEGYADYSRRERQISPSRLRSELSQGLARVNAQLARAQHDSDPRLACRYGHNSCSEENIGPGHEYLSSVCAHYVGRLMIETVELAAGSRRHARSLLLENRTLEDFFLDFKDACKDVGFTSKLVDSRRYAELAEGMAALPAA